MAKNSLPSVDYASHSLPRQQQKQLPVDSSSPQQEEGYQMSMAAFVRVDVKLPIKHREILRDKLRQLQDTGATLDDGTEVTDKTKAVLWILENQST